ncbi:hypothetical protein, partial [Phocaeicola plebeius]|uniref:hypothetical protein n=1 Tax=Phocaeicola plebeius TaxID=310297 RepID=UPI00307EAA38
LSQELIFKLTTIFSTLQFKRKCVWDGTQGRFFRHEKYQFLGPFSGEFKLPFRNSNFFFFHFLLYCKRKEYICLIHEKSLIKNCDHEHRTSQLDRPAAREAPAPNSPRKAVPDD